MLDFYKKKKNSSCHKANLEDKKYEVDFVHFVIELSSGGFELFKFKIQGILNNRRGCFRCAGL